MRIRGYIRVYRPPLMILGAVAPVGLYLWSHQVLDILGLLIFLTIFSGNLGWTLANEYMDEETDRVNKPWKPLPSGQVDDKYVVYLGSLLIFFSWIFNVVLAIFHPIYLIGFLGQATSFVYNVVRKDLLGNVCMATSYGLAAFISLYPHHLLFCLPFALLTLAHNLNNQHQDYEAERTAGVITVPQQLGSLNTMILSISLLSISSTLFYYIYYLTNYISLLIFLAVTVTTSLSTLSMAMEREKAHKIIENVARRLGRALLLVGFLVMLLV